MEIYYSLGSLALIESGQNFVKISLFTWINQNKFFSGWFAKWIINFQQILKFAMFELSCNGGFWWVLWSSDVGILICLDLDYVIFQCASNDETLHVWFQVNKWWFLQVYYVCAWTYSWGPKVTASIYVGIEINRLRSFKGSKIFQEKEETTPTHFWMVEIYIVSLQSVQYTLGFPFLHCKN